MVITIIDGRQAQERGMYSGTQFILEQEGEEYDEGYWFVADNNYAEWYADTDEGREKLAARFDEYLHN